MRAANLLDQVIGWVSPERGLKRHFARERLAKARAYEAASPRDGWRPKRRGASANADHAADATELRTRARALVQNVPYIAAGLDALVAATVGTGIVPRAIGRQAKKLNALMAEWAPVCDADGRFDLHGLVAAAYRAMEADGEVLVRLRPRRLSDGLPVPLQLQLLEIDWLDSTKNGTRGANTIINGVEYDQLGRVSAYWLFSAHPGDTGVLPSARRINSAPVPASSIIHLFNPARPGQGRGVTRLASVITRVRDLSLYEDAEIARKNLETRLSVIGTGDLAQMAAPGTDPEGLQPGGGAAGGAAQASELGELPSGGILQVPGSMNITVVEPKAAPGYVEYVKYQLHLIAAGLGVPYEALTGDMKEVNFSSARVRLLDFRRAVQQVQWLTLIPKLIGPIWRAFVDAAELASLIPERDYAVDYSVPKWDYINPEQDVKADVLEISVGLSTLSEKLRQRGYNPQTVFEESARDFEQLEQLGVLQTLLFLQKGTLPEAHAGGQAKAAAEDARALDAVRKLLQGIEQRLAKLEQPEAVPG